MFKAPSTHVSSSLGPNAPTDDQYLRQLLTYREMDVLRLLDQRLTNKEIARHLNISTETVRQHTVKLFHKLHVHNRRQAVVAARTLGYRSDLP
jgi:DNA-binding NarL/FixJ family response regulator